MMKSTVLVQRPQSPAAESVKLDPISIIERKRDNQSLTDEEINFFVDGFTKGSIEDYQAAAFCMAVFINSMSKRETAALTMAMARSGEVLDLSDVVGFALDKHSSGGVGDKTSLVVLPLVVANGVPVAKMSGRGLSFSGGTLDKLESISGLRVELTREEILRQVKSEGIVLCGQTADLAPADAKFYALRDVTGTVPSKPLIASSIMSKKIAAGAQGLVLDVKCGNGAFMQTLEDARDLGQLMVDIGVAHGRKVTALISDMNQPLGNAVGNALEVKEAIDALHGEGPVDFVEHCIVVAGQMLRLAGKSIEKDLSDIRPKVEETLRNGAAWDVFVRLVKAQGGSVEEIENPNKLPTAPIVEDVTAIRDGYLESIDARLIGLAALELGAGRHKKGEKIDHAVGLIVHHKVGEFVKSGEPLCTIHGRTHDAVHRAEEMALVAHRWTEKIGLPVFYDALFSD